MNLDVKKVIFVFSLLFIFSCNNEKKTKSVYTALKIKNKSKKEIFDFSYKDLTNVQSPINLQTSLTKKHIHNLEVSIDSVLTVLLKKSHTVELKISEGSYIESDYHKYEFKQLHFHTPAEHSIDKIRHPMEIHLVALKKDLLEPDLPKYLVIGITFNEGKHNVFIENILNEVSKIKKNQKEKHHEDVLVDLKDKPLILNDLFGDKIENHLNNMYHYKGSLTTPPYTESVEWYVLKETVEASKNQIIKMNKLIGDNARISQEKTHLDYGFENL